MRFAASASAGLLASVALAACTSLPAAPGYNDRQVTHVPVYCYKTLAKTDCFDQPQSAEFRRLAGYDDPIRWQQETEEYRARYRTPGAPQPSRGVAAPPVNPQGLSPAPQGSQQQPQQMFPPPAPPRPAVSAQPMPMGSPSGADSNLGGS